MRCSDCKYFKTEGCKLKPETEFFIAENFDCFQLDIYREASIGKQTAVLPESNDGGIWSVVLYIGRFMLWMGIVCIVIFLILFFVLMASVDEPYFQIIPLIIGGVSIGGSLAIAVIGAIVVYFAGKLEDKEYYRKRSNKSNAGI